MITIEKKIQGEIMSTNVYMSISSDSHSENEIVKDIEEIILTLKDFEQRYSRFKNDSELGLFNSSSGDIKVSDDFKEMLDLSVKYYELTGGVFDISILESLKKEGYILSIKDGFHKLVEQEKNPQAATQTQAEPFAHSSLTNIRISPNNSTVFKPKNITVDLGGIGKGYILGKIANKLVSKYQNFCIDLGGDMYCAGKDVEKNYEYWAIEIENPFPDDFETPLTILNNSAIATSGINKRKWEFKGEEKTHLIDPNTGKSIKGNILTSTAISNDAVASDIYAKTCLILGEEKGMGFANKNNLAVIFITKDKKIIFSNEASKYVWQS